MKSDIFRDDVKYDARKCKNYFSFGCLLILNKEERSPEESADYYANLFISTMIRVMGDLQFINRHDLNPIKDKVVNFLLGNKKMTADISIQVFNNMYEAPKLEFRDLLNHQVTFKVPLPSPSSTVSWSQTQGPARIRLMDPTLRPSIVIPKDKSDDERIESKHRCCTMM